MARHDDPCYPPYGAYGTIVSPDPTDYLNAQQSQKSQADCANQQTAQLAGGVVTTKLGGAVSAGLGSAYIGGQIPHTPSCPNCGRSGPRAPTIWGGANTQYTNANQQGLLYK